jgi:hypothetical protein
MEEPQVLESGSGVAVIHSKVGIERKPQCTVQ